jgi:hypothetical protein
VVAWNEFAAQAPHIAEVFVRRHTATGNLCLLATLRADGSPRISPMEPRIFEGQLVLVGMPGTTKFRDLGRDPRFCLHTATVDPHVADGDAKLWGRAVNNDDEAFHARWATDLFEATGFDLRNQRFDPFYVADITSASSLEMADNKLMVTIWKPGAGERTVEKS